MESYDLIVIGAGPGGYTAAVRASQLGLKVACVEKESALGGTCLRVGCIPSKALLESSELFAEATEIFTAHGIQVGELKLDLAAMMRRKEDVVRILTKGIEALFKKHNIARHFGLGRIVRPGEVVVKGSEGEQLLQAKHIIIATGSKAASLTGLECDGRWIATSTEALAYPEVPARLVVIGAGAIGLELASAWRRLGAKVTVLEFLPRILPGMDSEIAEEAQKIFTRQGLEFRLGCKVKAARVENAQCVVECEGTEPMVCDRVLVAVGRIPNTQDLGLETVNLAPDSRGRIPVDENFRTSVDGIYAIGDVIRGPMLAHKAEEEGIACVESIVKGKGQVNYAAIPSVVYTHPEVAAVGRTEDELKANGVAYRKGVSQFLGNGRARAIGKTMGRVKILADAQTDRILGVHILGAQAGDLIAEAVLAVALGATSQDLAHCPHAHPSLSEVIKEAARLVV